MLSARLLRTSASKLVAVSQLDTNIYNSLSPKVNRIYRSYCAAQPIRKEPNSSSSASKPASPANSVASETQPPSGGTQLDATGKDTTTRLPSTPNAQQPEQKDPVPDVPSTSWSSIGFEEADAKDPNKWKKFAWKYAGAVLLFMISYKTLHWYTDRLEADGKRKRKEMEEDRETVKEILTPKNAPDATQDMFGGAANAPQLPSTTSELDELYKYKAQLEANLQGLSGSAGLSAQQKRETAEEMKELEAEILILEERNKTS